MHRLSALCPTALRVSIRLQTSNLGLKNMDQNQLKAFIAIAETGSFSQAAEQLFLTQPAISKRLAQLEEQLGTRLFDRISRTIDLTEAGQTLLPKAYALLRDMDDIKRSITNLTGEISGTLTLGISHHLGLHRLPPYLQAFNESYPGVQLDIEFLDSEVAYDAVQQGKVELGIITLADQSSPNITSLPLWEDPLVFVAAKNHPLAKQRQITLEQLVEYDAIFPGLNTFTGRITDTLFQDHALKLKVSLTTHYLETIKMMVSIGLGWSLLPETLADNSVIQLKVPGIQSSRQLGAIHHKERTLSNAASAFLALLDNNLD